MRYGKIYDYKNAKEAIALIGKPVIPADVLWNIEEKPENFTPEILKDVTLDYKEPFTFKLYCTQFIREVIEEPEDYRPFTTAELGEQVGKVVTRIGEAGRCIITHWSGVGGVTIDGYGCGYSADELLSLFVFSDGTPCGVKKTVEK